MSTFSDLTLSDWVGTRDTIHGYARLLGAIRQGLAPPSKHWWHISLLVGTQGISSTPVPAKGSPLAFEVVLNLVRHEVQIRVSDGRGADLPLGAQSLAGFADGVLGALDSLDIGYVVAREEFEDSAPGTYDEGHAQGFWSNLVQIDRFYKEFKGGIREETGPVQLWPHHLDLALTWFSGRLVEGQDPADWESADEQMGFGFSTGDEGVPEPYFYFSAYPLPDGLDECAFPEGVEWLPGSFGILKYRYVAEQPDPAGCLLSVHREVLKIGSSFMKG